VTAERTSHFLEALIDSRLWVASMITCLTLFATLSLGLEAHSLPLALVFFCGVGIYNVDHVVDLPPGPRSRRARRLALGSLAAVLLLLTQASFQLALLVVLGTLAACAYFVPVPFRGRRVRIETVPVFKPLLIGCAVSTAAVFVPLVDALTQSPRTLAELPRYLPEALYRTVVLSLWCGANTLLFDVRDVQVDRASGVATAPVERGIRFTLWLVTALLLITTIAAEAGYRLGFTSSPEARRGVEVAALSTLCCTWMLPTRRGVLFALVVDGTLAVPLVWLVLSGALR
jgi:4-hydroxybenzoate polyprenyltransferase